MPRRPTFSQERYGDPQDFVESVKNWRDDAITIIWKSVWKGYDNYYQEILSQIDLSQDYEQIERDITQDLFIDIQKAIPEPAIFTLQHERYEMESRASASARPKQPDLSFVLNDNRRVSYTLEAKIVPIDTDVREYVQEINNNFLTCNYSPFSREGGMLGYLLRGSSDIAFENIAHKTPCTLTHHPEFPDRPHKTSEHQRVVPPEKPYPVNFCCHHLILEIFNPKSADKT